MTTSLRSVRVRYSGRVQGVGFRYTVLSLVRGTRITGFVRNEPDGSVQLHAEGSREELAGLLREIRDSHLGQLIRSAPEQWGASAGAFTDFRIRHDG